MSTIKAIEGRSVHQIQSGQVIIALCSVVKELVENSLDAGATSIDIRFKSQGLEAIEVQDNGKGIARGDYETICLKHYTSKLSTYEDLTSLDTFGFRGEALSSLCAVSKLQIITATDGEAPKGTKLDYESSGELQSTSVAACQRGTTFVAESLFHSLPVRRRELEKNIKREYARVVGVLNAYACVSTGVKISVTNQPTKAKKIAVFSTKSNSTVKDNIANVYGAKTITQLVPLELDLELQSTAPSQALASFHKGSQSTNSRKIHVSGQISRPVHGEGRQTPDRQMFFVNSRPCGLPQMAKAFNEVYKSYNVTQSPFIFANFKMDTNAYDVNVSPDKRTILLHDQGPLLESLKENLTQLFAAQDQTVPQSLPTNKLPAFQPLSVSRESTRDSPQTSESRRQSETPDVDGESKPHSQSTVAPSSAASSSTTDSQPGEASQLLSRFVARNAFERNDTNGRKKSGIQPTHATSKEKQKLAGKLGERNSDVENPEDMTEGARQDEFIAVEPSQDQQPFELPRIAQDFNARFARQQTKDNASRPNETEESKKSSTANHDRQSAAAKTLVKPFTAPVPAEPEHVSLQDSMTRDPEEVENRPSSPNPLKRPRVEEDDDAKRVNKPKQAESRFPNGLLAFAAPGSQMNLDVRQGKAITDYFEENREDDGEASSDHDESEQGANIDEQSVKSTRSDVAEESGADEEHGSGNEYIDEDEKKRREEARVQEMVRKAEESAAHPTRENEKRASNLLKPRQDKESTANVVKRLEMDMREIESQAKKLHQSMREFAGHQEASSYDDGEEDAPPAKISDEERLSLTISKSDFANMRIVGQFNLGFILAVRWSDSSRRTTRSTNKNAHNSELFIIDQHASDEIYNFSRLSASTSLTPQPLVKPHTLQLTAIEEETILAHREHSLAKNGFMIDVDLSGDSEVGRRCKLLTLPTSRETVFDTRDLEELLALLAEVPAPASPINTATGGDQDPAEHPYTGRSSHRNTTKDHSIVRPGKVRRTLAMRACRSSVMVGKPLAFQGMERVVRNMGMIDRPWNCPHGRPTMRHLAGLGDLGGWREDDDGYDGDLGVGDGLDDDLERVGGVIGWKDFMERSMATRGDDEVEDDDVEDMEGDEEMEGGGGGGDEDLDAYDGYVAGEGLGDPVGDDITGS